jgi:hypothetical protein
MLLIVSKNFVLVACQSLWGWQFYFVKFSINPEYKKFKVSSQDNSHKDKKLN